MTKINFHVLVKCPEVSEMLQTLSFKMGYGWREQKVKNTEKQALWFHVNGEIAHSDAQYAKDYPGGSTLVSIERAIELLSPQKITIGEYEVVFEKNQIKVGCQTISKEKVKEIYERLN